MLCVSVRCAVCGLLVCAVLGDTCHGADVVLCCVCLRAHDCGVMVAGSAALVGMCVRCALVLRKCEASWLRHTRAICNARLALCRAQ
jgi:hypothetical protein